MSFITRGFSGRSRRPRSATPAGPDARRGLPGAVGRPDARGRHRRLGVHDPHRERRRTRWNWDELTRPRHRRRHHRHPLRHALVEARACRWRGVLARHDLRERRDRARVRHGAHATAATRPTCRSRTCSTARPGSRSSSTASRSTPSTAVRRGCSCRTSTSGRARSGCAGS